MNFVNKRLTLSISFFILSMLFVTILQPSLFFNNDGSIKEFGVEKGQTIYSLGVIVVVGCIAIFYVFSMIDLIYN